MDELTLLSTLCNEIMIVSLMKTDTIIIELDKVLDDTERKDRLAMIAIYQSELFHRNTASCLFDLQMTTSRN